MIRIKQAVVVSVIHPSIHACGYPLVENDEPSRTRRRRRRGRRDKEWKKDFGHRDREREKGFESKKQRQRQVWWIWLRPQTSRIWIDRRSMNFTCLDQNMVSNDRAWAASVCAWSDRSQKVFRSSRQFYCSRAKIMKWIVSTRTGLQVRRKQNEGQNRTEW